MHYHIVINVKKDNTYGEYKTDLSEDQLLSRYIKPYELGTPMVIKGKTVEVGDIKRVQVYKSEEPISTFIASVKAEKRQYSDVISIGGPTYEYEAIFKTTVATDEYITVPIGSKKSVTETNFKDKNSSGEKKTEVFIVHGHDASAKSRAARFVEKFDLKAIILHEQPSSGKTIIEKIEHYSDVGFAIVLYTPDDVGNVKSKASELNNRARQNVVFEHGYLIGKLGRENVAALVEGQMETPNDISGVVYISLDEKSSWELELAKEMKASGYDLDMNKL